MTLPASEETVVPSTDEQIAVLESWLDERYRPVRVGIARNVLRSLIARIRSEREQAVRECAENVWRPIETAPRDGADLLLTAAHWNGDVVVGGFCFGAWRDRPDPYSMPIHPTHWMAIPTPPISDDGSNVL